MSLAASADANSFNDRGIHADPAVWTFTAQVVELDFLYPSEGIHRRWDGGYRITSTAATWDQAAFVLSIPRRRPADETQETLRTSAFPSTHVKVGTSHGFLDRFGFVDAALGNDAPSLVPAFMRRSVEEHLGIEFSAGLGESVEAFGLLPSFLPCWSLVKKSTDC